MSNLGLERHRNALGLRLERTKVGDRYVVERMRETKWNVGGEQSGHVVLSDYETTGDGLTAAMQLLSCLVPANRPASEVRRVFEGSEERRAGKEGVRTGRSRVSRYH